MTRVLACFAAIRGEIIGVAMLALLEGVAAMKGSDLRMITDSDFVNSVSACPQSNGVCAQCALAATSDVIQNPGGRVQALR